jgi:hypothetical protein
VLDGPGASPRQPVRQGVHSNDHTDPHEAEPKADQMAAVGAYDDVVQVVGEACAHHHRHMNDDEEDKSAHDEEVERAPDLPVAGQFRIPLEAVRQRR